MQLKTRPVDDLVADPNGEQGPRDRRGRPRRLGKGLLIALLVGLVIAFGLYALRVVDQVNREASSGRSELLAGAHALTNGNTGLSKGQLAIATRHFAAAESSFDKGHQQVTGNWIFRAVGWLPLFSKQRNAAADLLDMGVHAARAGRIATGLLESALDSSSPGVAPSEKLLRIVSTADPKLRAISNELSLVLADRGRISPSALLPPLANAVHQFDAKIDLKKAQALLDTVRSNQQPIEALLGADGQRSYLVLQQDPAELRATGGFIGSIGYLTFDHGKMAPFNPTDVYNIDGRDFYGALLGPRGSPKHVDPPAPLERTFQLQSWELRDSNWSPDFPTAARQAESFLKLEAGRQVDGVVTMDPYFVSKLLSITGPVTVPETGDVIDQNNFFSTTLTRVETKADFGVRKQFLSYAAKALFTRLLAIPSSKWYALAQALQWACETRSVQAYFHDASIEAFVNQRGCGGEVSPLSSDGLMIIDSNVGGNKDDFWLKRQFDLTIAVQPDSTLIHTLHLHYDGISPHPPVTGTWGYTGWLRIYLPPSAVLLSSHGANLASGEDLGRRVVAGWVYVPFYQATDVTIVYSVDGASIGGVNRGFSLYWQKQSGRVADPISVHLQLPRGWSLRSIQLGSSKLAKASIPSDLGIDRQITFDFSAS